MFEPNALKFVVKYITPISIPLIFYSSMLKSFSILRWNGAHLIRKNDVWKKKKDHPLP
jgi:hypothetical protein